MVCVCHGMVKLERDASPMLGSGRGIFQQTSARVPLLLRRGRRLFVWVLHDLCECERIRVFDSIESAGSARK